LPYLRGPLGLWPFPILNWLLQFFSVFQQGTAQQRKSPLLENIEEWQVIRDEEGLPKSIIVKRTVKRVS